MAPPRGPNYRPRVSPLPFPGSAPCPVCGEVHERCAQHRNHIEPPVQCRFAPRPGEKFCRLHGGNLPLVRAKAMKERQMKEARELAQTLGHPVDVDPHTAILNEIRWCAGHVAYYRAQVQKLDPNALVQGVRGVTQITRVGGPQAQSETTREAGPDIHVWLRLYGEERDRLARLCVAAIKAGVDERRVKIEEQQAALFAGALTWMQNEAKLRLDLSEAESKVFSEILTEMLGRLDTLESKVDA